MLAAGGTRYHAQCSCQQMSGYVTVGSGAKGPAQISQWSSAYLAMGKVNGDGHGNTLCT